MNPSISNYYWIRARAEYQRAAAASEYARENYTGAIRHQLEAYMLAEEATEMLRSLKPLAEDKLTLLMLDLGHVLDWSYMK